MKRTNGFQANQSAGSPVNTQHSVSYKEELVPETGQPSLNNSRIILFYTVSQGGV